MHEPSVYLDLSCSKEKNPDFFLGKKDLRNSSRMRFAHGDGDNMNLAMRKLDNLDCIKSYGGAQNDPDSLLQLKNKLDLSQLLAKIALLEQRDYQQSKDAIDTDL